jgi:hypothetical protein
MSSDNLQSSIVANRTGILALTASLQGVSCLRNNEESGREDVGNLSMPGHQMCNAEFDPRSREGSGSLVCLLANTWLSSLQRQRNSALDETLRQSSSLVRNNSKHEMKLEYGLVPILASSSSHSTRLDLGCCSLWLCGE